MRKGKHKGLQEKKGGKHSSSFACWTCDVFPLNSYTQEKQIINSPTGNNTQIE